MWKTSLGNLLKTKFQKPERSIESSLAFLEKILKGSSNENLHVVFLNYNQVFEIIDLEALNKFTCLESIGNHVKMTFLKFLFKKFQNYSLNNQK